jgi:hypothetical protein
MRVSKRAVIVPPLLHSLLSERRASYKASRIICRGLHNGATRQPPRLTNTDATKQGMKILDNDDKMDLHSILNASDSSASSNIADDKSFTVSEGSTGSQIDLERILREEEDDGDDDDNDDDKGYEVDNDNVSASVGRSDRWSSVSRDLSGRQSKHSNSRSGAHSAEDWAVLQAILGEDDDDDDADNDIDGTGDADTSEEEDNGVYESRMSFLDFSSTQPRPSLPQVQDSSQITLNDILQSDDDNDDTENDSATLPTISTLSSPTRPHSTKHSLELLSPRDSVIIPKFADPHIVKLESPVPIAQPTSSSLVNSQTTKLEVSVVSKLVHDDEAQPRPPPPLPVPPSNATITATVIAQANDEEMSRRALQYAQNYEKKLYKSGHREVVSPLMVKRRLRPKIELSSRTMHKKRPLAERLASLSAPRFNFAGVLENKSMGVISSQILRHSQPAAPVLCGLPTCIAFNSKFIAVGTQKGIILIFDLFEVLRQRLGSNSSEESWASWSLQATRVARLYYGTLFVALCFAVSMIRTHHPFHLCDSCRISKS